MRYFWKRGNIRKCVRWNRRLRLICTLCNEVSRKLHLHFILMFLLRYYRMVQLSLYKNWLLVSKITRGIWTNSEKQWKVQKVEIRWATFVEAQLFTRCSLFVKIHSLLVTCCKITRYSFQNSLVTCCRSYSLQQITCYSLQNSLVARCRSYARCKNSLVTRYRSCSLLKITRYSCKICF